MRLIDADAVLDILRNFDRQHADLENGSEDFVYGVETAIEVIEDAPFIDIVWCAECKFYNQRGSCFLRFTNLALIDKNNFCSCGRREKTDAEIH